MRELAGRRGSVWMLLTTLVIFFNVHTAFNLWEQGARDVIITLVRNQFSYRSSFFSVTYTNREIL